MTRAHRAGWALLVSSTLGSAFVALLVWPRLFDSTPPGLGRLVAARCDGALDAPCAVKTLALGTGRYWLHASAPTVDRLSVEIQTLPRDQAPAVLLLGGGGGKLAVAVERADGRSGWQSVATSGESRGQRRRVLSLAGIHVGDRIRVSLAREPGSGDSQGGLQLDEIGLFTSEHRLLADARSFLTGVPDRRLYNGLLTRACQWLAVLGALGAFLVPAGPRASWARAAFVLALTLAVACLELWVLHNPYWFHARDLRVMLASGPVQEGIGANLNYGMYLGSRLLQGEGVTFGPRWVPWERMPGYAFFGALAGLIAGYKTDIFTIGLFSIALHVAFLGIANAAFAAAAAHVMHPGVAVAAALAVTFMPNQLANTQADSIMVPIYLLTAAALCLYLDRERLGGWPPFHCHLLVHLAFALWFVTRPEGVVGWAAISAILYFRRWRYLALPAVLYLAIGLPWALYKRQYTGEFSMTTNTVGDNAWIGLWQVPNKFRWQTADASYFEWAERVGVPAMSQQASSKALREVARFSLTYPVYVVHLFLHKFVLFVDAHAFTGNVTFPRLDYNRLSGPGVFALLCVVALGLTLPHEGRRTLLLGWPLFFNVTLFLLFFWDGMRHTAPVTAALFVTAIPVLAEPGFYRALASRRRRAASVVAAFVAAWFVLRWADAALLASDAWRYWTPFLDPAPFAWYLR